MRCGAAFVAVRSDGAVLLRRRPDDGLLGGMSEVPGTAWSPQFEAGDAFRHAPFKAAWQPVPGPVVHVFTHFRLELDVYCAHLGSMNDAAVGGWWAAPSALPGEALPSVMKKVIEAALPGATKKRKRAA
jgi:A/G-specific adenine glycosylase